MKTSYMALIGRFNRVLQDLENVVNRTTSLMDKAQRSGDDDYLDGVALNLHGYYAGVEKIFEDIARTVEKSIPDGSGWHQDLLLQMTTDNKQLTINIYVSSLWPTTQHLTQFHSQFYQTVRLGDNPAEAVFFKSGHARIHGVSAGNDTFNVRINGLQSFDGFLAAHAAAQR